MKPVIAVDIDDVCLNLIENWIRRYNEDFDDNLKKEDIKDWSIHVFVKKEAKDAIYEYVQSDEVFLEAEPVENSYKVITLLKKWSRVIYVTANDPMNCKFKWLLEHGFISSIKDFVVAYDKSLIKSDILIDDNFNNVKNRKGGWLFEQPWNLKYKFENRVKSWTDIQRKIENGTIRL